MLKRLMLTVGAAALVAAPVAAQAAPVRVAAPVEETEELSQGLLLVLLASFVALVVLALADISDLPASP